jgi:hypothetical protein
MGWQDLWKWPHNPDCNKKEKDLSGQMGFILISISVSTPTWTIKLHTPDA